MPETTAPPSPATTPAPPMRRYDVIAEICDDMQALGWSPYQSDHEGRVGRPLRPSLEWERTATFDCQEGQSQAAAG